MELAPCGLACRRVRCYRLGCHGLRLFESSVDGLLLFHMQDLHGICIDHRLLDMLSALHLF